MKISRKKLENWFLTEAYRNNQKVQAETMESFVALALYDYQEEFDDSILLDTEFCLVHYSEYNDTDYPEYLHNFLSNIFWEVIEAEEFDSNCDCEIEMDIDGC